MSIKNCRLFKMVADSGFKQFFENLLLIGSKFRPNVYINKLIPYPSTISRNVNKVYSFYFKTFKSEVATIKNNCFGLTSDLWTDNYLRKTFIAITIQNITEGSIVFKLLGMKSMKGEKSTSK